MCVPWHTSVCGTLPLTETSVATNAAGGSQGSGTSTGVHCDGLLDDKAIGEELADSLAGVGVGDLIDFVRVEPDLALSAADNGRRKALLRAEVDPVGHGESAVGQEEHLVVGKEVDPVRGLATQPLPPGAARQGGRRLYRPGLGARGRAGWY
jgi:hypothetical protein